MGRRRTPGLVKRNGVWHIDKTINGERICRSTETGSLDAAEEYLRQVIDRKRRPAEAQDRIWREAAIKYLLENQHKASIQDDADHLEQLDPYIGHLGLRQVHDLSLQPFVEARRAAGRKTKTINMALGLVRLILNLAARSWRDEHGQTWLQVSPIITMVKPPKGLSDAAKPYPLDWDEQEKLFKSLPDHLARMALYAVNTGCREAEICGLLWEWEWRTTIKDLRGRVFIIPGDVELTDRSSVKSRRDRVVVLNDVAKSVVDSVRGEHPTHVFVYRGQPMARMNNSGWQRQWKKSGLPTEGYLHGVHNLRHTFARRLRAAGVGMETRKALMDHATGDITTHYSAAEIGELLTAVQRLCERESRKNPALSIVRLRATA